MQGKMSAAQLVVETLARGKDPMAELRRLWRSLRNKTTKGDITATLVAVNKILRECHCAPGPNARDSADAIVAKRVARAEARKGIPGMPVPMRDRWLAREFARAVRHAGFRGATHSHSWDFKEGDTPLAQSSTSKADPTSVGLAKSYAKKAYFVTTSSHDYVISRTWLRDVKARGLALVDGRLTLACSAAPDPEVRGVRAYRAVFARQGRGTALETESGYLVDVGGEFVRVATARAAERLACRVTKRAA